MADSTKAFYLPSQQWPVLGQGKYARDLSQAASAAATVLASSSRIQSASFGSIAGVDGVVELVKRLSPQQTPCSLLRVWHLT